MIKDAGHDNWLKDYVREQKDQNFIQTLLSWSLSSFVESFVSALGAVHKLRHFKIDLYGASNNDWNMMLYT